MSIKDTVILCVSTDMEGDREKASWLFIGHIKDERKIVL